MNAWTLSEGYIPVAAPMDTDSAARGGDIALKAVVRVIRPNSAGTGFLHKSGKILTAEHVIRGCHEATLILSDGRQVGARVVAADAELDVAILEPASKIPVAPLPLSSRKSFSIGAHVSTWGYPGGYNGLQPMLSAGYLSAVGARQIGHRLIRHWVVNAAFNSGNSGGPLILIETGEVIGIVSSKLAPISQFASSAIRALHQQPYGVTFDVNQPDGSNKRMSEGQIVAVVLEELRQQVQLVIGHAVFLEDLYTFLSSTGVDA